ncbi:hypothetical protein AGMMS50230_06870 [Spirochaetia bacterium]|nr:hypothetical protein AGMMS50230_06870 [Spirochaetia bacterium]
MENSQAFSLVLFKEVELLEKIPPLQALLRDAVIKREWTDYEILMESISEIGTHFDILEKDREALFKTLAEGEEPDSFYAYAARLPEGEREEISILYRKLKITALQIKIANDTLMEYLREIRSAVSGVLEKAYPDRRGKMYSRRGTEREADMRSLMVNQTF